MQPCGGLGKVALSGKKQVVVEAADYARAEEQHDFGKAEIICADKLLDREAIRDYRSATARCNYLAADRPDIAFATKELCRAMSAPAEADVIPERNTTAGTEDSLFGRSSVGGAHIRG